MATSGKAFGQAAAALAGAAVLAAVIFGQGRANAIEVAPGAVEARADGRCSLVEAIRNANNEANGLVYPDCAAGDPSGGDVINLPAGSVFRLTQPHNQSDFGPNGLPWVGTEVTINGNGATIWRPSTAPEFRVFAVGPSGNLTLNRVSIEGGLVADHPGAGILNQGRLTVRDSQVRANYGEGIYSSDDAGRAAALTVTGSTISANGAEGIWSRNGTALVVNSTLSGNGGGGLLNGRDGVMTVVNSTITANTGTNYGGGVFNFQGRLTLQRNVLSGNSAPQAAEVYNTGQITTGDNLLAHAGMTTAQAFGNFMPGASDMNGAADALALPLAAILDSTLANHSGPTPTHALPPGSPAIDRAANALCAAAPVSGGDQRGQPRNTDGNGAPSANECDLGAHEAQGSAEPTPTPPPPGQALAFVPAVTYSQPPFAGPFEAEPNNNPLLANGPILLDQPYLGLPNDARDYYYVDLPAVASLSVALSGYVGRNPQLQVLRGGELLAYDWNEPFQIVLTDQPAGRYFVMVYVDGWYSQSESYTLRVTATGSQ